MIREDDMTNDGIALHSASHPGSELHEDAIEVVEAPSRLRRQIEAREALVVAAVEWLDARTRAIKGSVDATVYDKLARAEHALQKATEAVIAADTLKALDTLLNARATHGIPSQEA